MDREFELPPPDEHGLDLLRAKLTENREATRTAIVAKAAADDAARHATELGERVRVLEHRGDTTDQKLDRVEGKVDAVNVQIGRLLERSPWERAVYLALALSATAWFVLALADRALGSS